MLHTLMAYLFAPWHLRRMPADTEADRLARAVWCRDHCGTLAGRWIFIAMAGLLVQLSPLGFLLVIQGWPLGLLVFLLAFILGIAHLAGQIISQKKAGPPRIDPPMNPGSDD